MMFGIALSALLILLVIVVAAAFLLSRWPRGRALRFGRRPRKRHAVVRILCGLLGVAILTAVGLRTRSVALQGYEAHDLGAHLTLHVPASPSPRLPEPKGPFEEVEVAEARLLLHLVLADFSTGILRPLHVEEFEVEWPRDRGRHFRCHYGHHCLSFSHEFAITRLYVQCRDAKGAPSVSGEGYHHDGYDSN
jgi:hypothetical protein